MIYSCLTANVRFDPWLFCIFLRDARSFESRPARAEHSQLHLLCSLMLTLDLLSRSASNKLQTVTTAEKITCRSADCNVKSGGSFCVCVCVYFIRQCLPQDLKPHTVLAEHHQLTLIFFLLSQTPWCPWSRKCNYKLLCTPQACFSERNHGPKTRLPGVLHCTSWGLQSHPEKTKVIFTGATMCDDADVESLLPDRSPSLPSGSQHRSCFQSFEKDTH